MSSPARIASRVRMALGVGCATLALAGCPRSYRPPVPVPTPPQPTPTPAPTPTPVASTRSELATCKRAGKFVAYTNEEVADGGFRRCRCSLRRADSPYVPQVDLAGTAHRGQEPAIWAKQETVDGDFGVDHRADLSLTRRVRVLPRSLPESQPNPMIVAAGRS